MSEDKTVLDGEPDDSDDKTHLDSEVEATHLDDPDDSRDTLIDAEDGPVRDLKHTSFGKYKVIRELGQGAMGMVYLAEDPDLGRKVAIKTIIAGEDASQKSIDRFMLEARSAAKLHHNSIVPVHEVASDGNVHFIVMDFIEGEDIQQIIARTSGKGQSDECHPDIKIGTRQAGVESD